MLRQTFVLSIRAKPHRLLKEEQIGAKVIMISAVGQQSVVEQGFKLGAIDYLVKPFTAEQLLAAVRKAELS